MSQPRIRVADVEVPELEALVAPPGMRSLRADALAARATRTPVLVTGETGTGKTLLACALAEGSPRRPVVRATPGANDDVAATTSELFGQEPGSRAGSELRRSGLVEHANGGTLVIEEALALSPVAQQLLLDFVQFGTYRPLGHAEREPRHADVRLIAVTNGDLPAAVRAGRFRADLYYRLAAVTLHLPALRDRRGDIPELCDAVLVRAAPRGERWTLSPALRRAFSAERLTWPGNVRQLEALLRRALDRARYGRADIRELSLEHLDERDFSGVDALAGGHDAPAANPTPAAGISAVRPLREAPSPGNGAVAGNVVGSSTHLPRPLRDGSLPERWQATQAFRATLDAHEDALVQEALAAHGGVLAHAARTLGLARTTLASRIEARAAGAKKRGAS